MGLLVLIFVGAVTGWIASIAMRVDDFGSLFLNAGTGILGAVGAGLAVYQGSLSGMTAIGILLGGLAAMSLIMVLNVVRQTA